MGFAQRIDGRIGDLRETLLAVIPERARERGEKCGGRVVAHAPIGFFSGEKRVKKNFVLVVGPAGSAGEAPGLADGGARSVIREIEERRDRCGFALNLCGDAL